MRSVLQINEGLPNLLELENIRGILKLLNNDSGIMEDIERQMEEEEELARIEAGEISDGADDRR